MNEPTDADRAKAAELLADVHSGWCGAHPGHADAILLAVTAWHEKAAEAQARARAAEPILCPKCKGLGVVSRPPWVPADVHTWSQPTAAPYRCDLCDGRKVVTTAALAADDRTDPA